MTAFTDIHCCARKSKICHRIDPNCTGVAHDKEKNFKLSTSEFTKIRHFEITKQNICPLLDFSPVGRGVPGWEGNTHPTLHPLWRFVPPNFELALTPLPVIIGTFRDSSQQRCLYMYIRRKLLSCSVRICTGCLQLLENLENSGNFFNSGKLREF